MPNLPAKRWARCEALTGPLCSLVCNAVALSAVVFDSAACRNSATAFMYSAAAVDTDLASLGGSLPDPPSPLLSCPRAVTCCAMRCCRGDGTDGEWPAPGTRRSSGRDRQCSPTSTSSLPSSVPVTSTDACKRGSRSGDRGMVVAVRALARVFRTAGSVTACSSPSLGGVIVDRTS